MSMDLTIEVDTLKYSAMCTLKSFKSFKSYTTHKSYTTFSSSYEPSRIKAMKEYIVLSFF